MSFTSKDGFLILQNNSPMFAVVGNEADANVAAQQEANRTRTPITSWSKMQIQIRDKIPYKAIAGDINVNIPDWADPNKG